MTDKARDPRVDPMPGDVLQRVWHLETDTVEVLDGGMYRSRFGNTDRWMPARPINPKGWRIWASNATIIKRTIATNGEGE